MREYDPMQDSTSRTDSQSSPYTYRTDDGRGYTTPDGSHGFIYNPDGANSERRNRRYKGAVIALSMVIVTLLLAICCLVGAFLAARSLHGETPGGEDPETTVEPNTSGGLSINDDTSANEEDTLDGLLPDPNGGDKETVAPPSDNTKPDSAKTAYRKAKRA